MDPNKLTRDEIIEMAREAWGDTDPSVDSAVWCQNLERFAHLIEQRDTALLKQCLADLQDLLDDSDDCDCGDMDTWCPKVRARETVELLRERLGESN